MDQKILFVGAEIMPFAATGGLGDVMGSLPAALAERNGGADYPVRCVMPLYDAIPEKWRSAMTKEIEFYVPLAWRNQYCGVWSLVKDGVKYYFIDNEYYFKRGGVLYGQYDDGERYAYFCMAVLAMMERLGWYPDILHANDWQSALSVVYLKTVFRYAPYYDIKAIFTIHNIEYQGKYGFEILGDVFALSEREKPIVEYDGCINLMKGAIVCADRVTTVSPRYAKEIRDPAFAHGLEGIINANSAKVSGILNGIDTAFYDPQTDPVIPSHYTAKLFANKKRCRTALRDKLNLPDDPDTPLLFMITRLASHKGLEIVEPMLEGLVAEKNVQFVVLGKGEARFEQYFRYLEGKYPDRVRALIAYDRNLSKEIYAAGDIFIMPSKSEPCGLAQMIASRYGALPVVRETGGLADSIAPFHEEEGKLVGNGVTFANYDPSDLYYAVTRALAIWEDKKTRGTAIRLAMGTDFSWKKSAERYESLYLGL
ncbi:MAG: glycogen synthase [Lachnospiraceae bacterium]|nr:glycogen synthase [Lachnospiraceae bacterium]